MKRYTAFFIGISLFFNFFQISGKDIQIGIEELKTRIPEMMQDWDVPGMSLAIVYEDRVIFSKGYGKLQVDKDELVDADTLFAIGSTTKAITCAALAILVEKGEFTFDTPVSELLPSVHWNCEDIEKQLTLSDLLAHRTGLESSDLVWYKSGLSFEEILTRLRYVKSKTPFRSFFTYNNLTYLAAGQIISQRTGQSWKNFVQDNLLTPLEMRNTFTSVSEAVNAKNIASSHMTIEGQAAVIERENNDNIGPAASIYSSANDMSKWMRFLLNNGKFNDQQLLSSEMIKQLWEPRISISLDSIYAKGYPNTKDVAYGLGWFLHDYCGNPIVEHMGVIDGMHALVSLLPESGLGIVVLTNTGNLGLPMTLKYILLDSFFDFPQTDWHAFFLNGMRIWAYMQAMEEKKVYGDRLLNTKPTLKLEEYTGTYRHDLYGNLIISERDGNLYVDFSAFHGILEHWQNDTFRSDFSKTMPARPLKGLLIFELDSEKHITRVKIQNSEIDEVFFK